MNDFILLTRQMLSDFDDVYEIRNEQYTEDINNCRNEENSVKYREEEGENG